MAPPDRGGGDGIDHTSAKHLLDSIGKKVYDKVHGDALERSHSKLKGDLSSVKFYTKERIEKSNVTNPCQLEYQWHTNVTDGFDKHNPCGSISTVRFSDVIGGQCTNKKIKGNEEKDGKDIGACAPFRRLFLCDQNLAYMPEHKINNTHDLLLEVLLAAKYEGQMIAEKLQEYDKDNYESRICTILARSFADIGDIIRGKDLFIGYNQKDRNEKKQLDKKLKEIFGKIHGGLMNGAQNYYNDNDKDGNYYKLREDWWNANRQEIWKAITCGVTDGDKYFRNTCSSKNVHYRKCHCINGDVLTNFDYVPQYLRWLEEWAEDFCRKRKHKLENAIKKCRGTDSSGKPKYCSRNGYDCINTVRIQRELVKGSECNDCYSSCIPFVDWIDNQKLEFLKQKNKYEKEIKESNENTEKKTKHGPINNLYVKDFYDILKEQYGTVENFLQLLSKEQICQSEPQVEQGKASSVKFTEDNVDKTFAHTEYCEPCPWCGLKDKNDGTWERKGEGHKECPQEKEKTFNKENTTEIPILYPDSGNKTILQKYRNFCQNAENNKQIKEWQCHYEKTDKSDDCVLHDEKKGTSKETIMSYHPFFWKWVTEMLDDSIEWRKELDNCLKKENKQCISKCNGKCGCFAKWVKQKETEWENVKKHFGKQDFVSTGPLGQFGYYFILEGVLNIDELFKNIEKDYGDAEEIKHIKEIMANKNTQQTAGGSPDGKKKTTIDLLFEDEEKEAEECLKKHQEKCPQDISSAASSLDPDSDDEVAEEEPETDSDRLCDDKKEPKCNDFQKYTNSTCEPKKNLIGLGAHFYKGGVDYPNVYISPRVQQLCLEPLQELKEVNKNTSNVSKLIEAFTKCAYNEAKGLYKYYNDNKKTFENNGSTLSEKEIEKYILKAMERSYADYGSIVKGDILCDYKDKKNIDPKIINFVKHHNTSTTKTSVSKSDDEDSKRLNLWELMRTNVWKAMLCGYKDAGGSFDNHDVQCKLPDTEKTNQLFRWFIEWGENFCIRREQELKRLKGKCEKGICNGTDETKKKECKMLCESYKQFLSNSKTQYENQKKEYEDLKYTIPEFMKKDALTFLKEKCNSKCLCFETKDKTDVHELFKYPSDDVKDECVCKEDKSLPGDKLNDLDKCPTEENNNICNTYKKRRMCTYSNNRNSLEYWYGKDMLIPPRRRKICLRNITGSYFYKKQDGKNKFKNALLSAAMSEASFLCNNYEDKREALQAIKYTFADIGDIIKGKDMMDDMAYKKIKVKLENVLEKTGNNPDTPEKWWEENKKHVWNAMLCGYKEAGGTIEPNDCNIPYEENTKQFLRWLIEWGRQVCKEKVIQKRLVDDICNNSKAFGSNSSNKLEENSCKTIAMVYDNWNKHAYNSLVQLNKEYKRYIGTSSNSQKITESSAEDYLKKTCKECNCSFSDIKKTYERSIKPDFEVLKDIVNKSSIPPDLEDIFNKYNGPYVSCPDSNLCIPYKNIPCFGNEHDDDTDWSPSFIKHNNRINKGVLLPPRRKHLCLRIYRAKFYHLRKEINNFKEFIFSSAFAEAKRLKKVYKDDNNKLLHAMKYSFSDIGNIVKGDDMMEGTASDNIAKIFKGKKYKETNRKKWWNENKYHVWESMLCGYRQDTGQITNNENCRFPDIESVPQFLRWFQEWTKIFCTKRNKLYDKMVSACENAQCDKKIGNVQGSDCMKACEKYKYYVLSKKKEYEIQSNKYDKEFKMTLKSKTAPEFLNVPCLSQYFSEKIKWENPYDTFDDDKHKGKCDCKKIESSAPVVPDSRPSSEKPEPPLLPPSDEPFDPTILQTTIPFGVALALGSIAFLFLKVKENIYVWGICLRVGVF
ncbi:erythrocyte membrane protein 1 [Plasmodium falciparum RAJ116]|uniref:Erythrocyte membrane protein 1 n=1 Tax=Plasmodium falciparum RAJ116 TaxID=580058 RepID=A0A0L0CSR5_PLAFA|nr:erythrocyte membrane protein 1 [Plasmodium falciparum RAJ116]